MSSKESRLEAIRFILSSQEINSQVDLRTALKKEGYEATQATLSRDLKQMKVSRAITNDGRSVYVLPNITQYRRIREHKPLQEMKKAQGILSLKFSGNIGVIRTRPGYASSLAYDIDNADIPAILGTVAGDDTILIILKEGVPRAEVVEELSKLQNHE